MAVGDCRCIEVGFVTLNIFQKNILTWNQKRVSEWSLGRQDRNDGLERLNYTED
jgi:hypothetical protein